MIKVSITISFEEDFIAKYAKDNNLDFETAAKTLFSNSIKSSGNYEDYAKVETI
jgi:hypothetical protein